LPSAPAEAETDTADVRPWVIRRVDIDPLQHVNNAAHWAALEEIMAERRSRRRGVAEIEFLVPLDAPSESGGSVDLVVARAADPVRAWLVSTSADRPTTHTTLRYQPKS
jgi:acyl-ACP thioesterase